MPVNVDQLTVNRLTTGVKATFHSALTESRAALSKPSRLVSFEVPSGAQSEIHNFIENVGPLREWPGDKKFQKLRERQFQVINKRFEKSVEVDLDRVADRGVGAADVNAGRILALSASEFDDRSIWLDGFNVAHTTLLDFTGSALIANSKTIAPGVTMDNYNDGGGGSGMWFLVAMQFGAGPIGIQRREDYMVKAQDDPQSEPVFNRRAARYSVEARLRVFAGIPQFIYGADVALTGANIDAAMQAMAAFPDASGEPMGVVPTHLVVGRANNRTARTILNSEVVQGSSAGISNVDRGLLDLVYAPRLA